MKPGQLVITKEPRPFKLAIATLLEGPPETATCHFEVQRQQRKVQGEVIDIANIWGLIVGNVDVVRARNRLARIFLQNTDATHLLWWDSDILVDDLTIIPRLLETGHECVGVPYRRKSATEIYPYRLIDPSGDEADRKVERGCIEIDWIAAGFLLTSRACLQAMWDAYHADRWYIDYTAEKREHHETISLFEMVYTETRPGPDGHPWRTMLSEDYSFCKSYRDIGGQVHMYVGQGSPVAHIGATVYRGTREGVCQSHA